MNGQSNNYSAMLQLWLRFRLESDATFGRGDGIPGLVDRDVALDEYGCPYLHGRTLKGLLVESCADLLFVLGKSTGEWKAAADALFGLPGSGHEQGILRLGHAQLPAALHAAIRREVDRNGQNSTIGWTRQEVTASLTTIRAQTAVSSGGAPDPRTLRTMRVILRQTCFEAQINHLRDLTPTERALLAACVKGLRRAGTARNRGRGRLVARLEDPMNQNVGELWFKEFKTKVGVA